MRTRIALVAIIPVACIAVIIVSFLTPSSARAASPASTTSEPSASTTEPTSTTPSAPPVPTTGAAPAPAPASTAPPFPGLRPISPVLTETALLVNFNTELHNEAVFHQALLTETQFLEAMATEGEFHQSLADEAHLYETLLAQRTVSGPSSAGDVVTAIGLPYTASGSGDSVTPAQRAAWDAWPCARRVATGAPTTAASAVGSASHGQTGSPTGVVPMPPKGPWPPRTSRSWWPNASSPQRRTSTAVTAGRSTPEDHPVSPGAPKTSHERDADFHRPAC